MRVINRLFLIGIAEAFLAVVLDQLSKFFIIRSIDYGSSVSILPFLDATLVFNRGVSFGFLAAGSVYGLIGLVALASAITVLMGIWLWKSSSIIEASGFALIIGGAIGNITDRLRLGAVIDFIHFHWGSFSFPAFNLADSFITIGAVLVLWSQIILRQKPL